jgi:hypothetical protein
VTQSVLEWTLIFLMIVGNAVIAEALVWVAGYAAVAWLDMGS